MRFINKLVTLILGVGLFSAVFFTIAAFMVSVDVGWQVFPLALILAIVFGCWKALTYVLARMNQWSQQRLADYAQQRRAQARSRQGR